MIWFSVEAHNTSIEPITEFQAFIEFQLVQILGL